jgi:hypothetical protein
MKNNEIVVYMDGVDFMYEAGHAPDGNKIYPGVKSLKQYNRCWEGCGIVKCHLVFDEWVVEHDFKKMAKSSKTYTAKEIKENSDIMRLESAQKYLEHLEQLVENQKHKVIDLKVNLKPKKAKK